MTRPTEERRRTAARPGSPAARAIALLGGIPSATEEIASRALALVTIEELSQREQRLLSLAEELGPDDRTRHTFVHHIHVYLALACCSWAANTALAPASRSAALAAAISLGATTSENLREVMGLNEKLRILATLESNPELARQAVRVASSQLRDELEAHQLLEPVVAKLEAAGSHAVRGTR